MDRCNAQHPHIPGVVCIHWAGHVGSCAAPNGTGKTMHRWWKS